ncbi:MAG: hypothetical protein JWO03_1574 [Bacteroidetes bacterium]|nr:hypothetical protein [Bacteroidota bacterium]
MKKILLTFVCIAFLALTVSAAAGPGQKVTHTISLNFPFAPHVSGSAALTSYASITDTCSYLATTEPYINDGKVHDSITLISWYEGVLKGILKASRGTLVRKDTIRVVGLQAMEIEYVRGDKNSLPVTFCSRALLANGELLVYSFTAPSLRYDKMSGLKKQFFSSIQLRGDTVITQYQPRSIAAAPATSPSPAGAVIAKSDSASHSPATPTRFLDSHAGSVIKMFGLLILFCAIIYFFATLSRRKG